MRERGPHDMGGDAAGPIDTHDHVPTLTERRIDAMMQLIRDKRRRLWRTDENRRAIESMEPDAYAGATYYARWVHAMRALLVEKGILSEAEIETKLAAIKARLARGDGGP
jgi:Nitrile hydratase beta subunit